MGTGVQIQLFTLAQHMLLLTGPSSQHPVGVLKILLQGWVNVLFQLPSNQLCEGFCNGQESTPLTQMLEQFMVQFYLIIS